MIWVGPSGAEETRVPDLVGLTVSAARVRAREAGLTIATADPDGPPLSAYTWPGRYVITGQRPAPGSVLRRRGTMVVEFMPAPAGRR